MKKILIIDDDMDICHLLKRLLSKNGYEVVTAHNGVNGIAALSIGNPPDLVMTDFRARPVAGRGQAPLRQLQVALRIDMSDGDCMHEPEAA